MNNKIFMGLRLPPPVHGESLMSTYILGCPTFRERFSISYIDIKAAEKIDDFNKFSVKKIANIFATYFKFVYKLIFFKPQVVYIAISPIGISFYKDAFLIMAAKLLRKKVVLHLHGKGIDYSISKHSINAKLYPIILKNTYCICLSNALISDIDKIQYKQNYILNNAIPVVKNITHNKRKQEEIVIIFLSNLVEEKGIITFLHVCAELKKRDLPFKALIAGKPFDISVEYINNYIEKNSLLKYVEYVGPKFNNEKNTFLENADVMLFPTKYKNETFSLVLLEAMQFGVIPISSNEGGIPEMYINNTHGFITGSEDIQKMADYIELLQKNNEKYFEVSKAAKAHFNENYTLEVYDKNLTSIFSKVLESK